jgi:hypothetical protein
VLLLMVLTVNVALGQTQESHFHKRTQVQ